jgi:long-chain-fatty-acid--CoA ligase ACSBG
MASPKDILKKKVLYMDQLFYMLTIFSNYEKQLLKRFSDIWLGIEKPGHCASIVYTSGTTGKGKGVLLSHDNYAYLAHILAKTLKPEAAMLALQEFRKVDDNQSNIPNAPQMHQMPSKQAKKSNETEQQKKEINKEFSETDLKFSFASKVDKFGTKPKNSDSEDVPRILSYLPLSHVAAQFFDIVASSSLGASVYFSDPEVLKGQKLLQYLQLTKPTHFFSVPRVYEKMKDSVMTQVEASNVIRRTLVKSAFKTGIENFHLKMTNPKKLGLKYKMMDKLVFSKLKQKMGLDKCEYFIYGAAPLGKEVREFFASFGVYLNNIYGLSETAGGFIGTNMQHPHEYTLKSVGKAFPGLELKIEPGTGEILAKGRSCFMGYLNNISATKKVIDNKRFFHTGDIGKIDQNGQLWITGRIKEIIVTAGGENVAPNGVEQRLKKYLGKIFWQIVCIGDQKKFISALMFLKNKNDPTMDVARELDEAVVLELEKIGVKGKTYEDILDNPQNKRRLYDYVQKMVNLANQEVVSRAAQVKKFSIPKSDLCMELNDLTPTLKVKRNKVNERFKKEIDNIYMTAKL